MRDFWDVCRCLWCEDTAFSRDVDLAGSFVSDPCRWLLRASTCPRLALLRHKTLWGLVNAVFAQWTRLITELLLSDSKRESIIMIQWENIQWSITHITLTSIYVVQKCSVSVLSSKMKYLHILGFPSTLCLVNLRAQLMWTSDFPCLKGDMLPCPIYLTDWSGNDNC